MQTYGQTFIRDDHFMAAVSSVSSVFNCLGRLVFGALADRFSFQVDAIMSRLVSRR